MGTSAEVFVAAKGAVLLALGGWRVIRLHPQLARVRRFDDQAGDAGNHSNGRLVRLVPGLTAPDLR